MADTENDSEELYDEDGMTSDPDWRAARERIRDLLKENPICAWPLVQTGDMGIQYEFAWEECAGDGFVSMWPLLIFDGISQERWDRIRRVLRYYAEEDGRERWLRDHPRDPEEDDLDESELLDEWDSELDKALKGTQLEGLAEDAFHSWAGMDKSHCQMFEGLLALPDTVPERFWCLFGSDLWDDERLPEFFLTQEELLETFRDRDFGGDTRDWDSMDTDELQVWADSITERGPVVILRYTT